VLVDVKKLEFDVEAYTFQIDYVGHVSNIVYLEWLEMGRTKLLQAMGLPIRDLTQAGIFPVLTSTTIEYKQPVFLGDRLRVEMWISELRHASARIEFRFYKNGNVLTTSASQRGLFIDRESMRPARMTREMRTRFAPYLAEDGAMSEAS
jgi:acyl-CoA thioester hydrolase